MQISKKSLIIWLSSLAIVGSGIAYYFISRDNTDILGWTDSSWLYRKSVTVSNSGDALTNEDVLVEVDTASLVTAGKLQPDCDDLRFVDSDDSTYLSYWVEGGCNTSTTQIWIQIPSLPNGGKTIYMYYGNDAATNSEASWSGNFVLLADTDCPSGWTRDSSFDGKFIYGSSSYGTTGGSDSHNHGGSISVTTGIPTSTVPPRDPGSGGSSAASSTHTHTALIPIDSTTVLPPYLTMIFCKNTDLNIFSGLIAIYDNATLPSNWTRFTALDDKFPYGGSTYGATGGTATHTHTVSSATTGTQSGDLSINIGNVNYQVVNLNRGTHTHTASPTMTTDSNLPPYISLIYAKASTNPAYSSVISIVDQVPPLGWTRFSSLDNLFGMGSSSYGTTGGTSSHTHTVTITTSTASSNNNNDGGSSAVSSGNHSHNNGSATTSSQSNLPPYISVIYAKRKVSLTTTIGVEEIQNIKPYAPSSLLTEESTNPIGITDLTPEFSAIFSDSDATDTGNYYQIQVNTTSDFSGTFMWDSTKTAFNPVVANNTRSPNISYAGTALQKGTTYYWRIKFWDNNALQNESDWSTTAQFTTNAIPTAPTSLYLQGTSNPTKVLTTTPAFSAIFHDPDTIDTGTYYQIQVNTASDFSGMSMWDSNKTSITAITNGTRSANIMYSGISLTEGETYYWKIKFWDNNDYEGEWSSINQFIMQGTPDIPTELKTNNAINPAQLTSVPPTFSAFYTDPNGDSASAYQINVNSNSSFTGAILWDSGKVATTILDKHRSSEYQYNGTELNNSHNTYYWRIRFWDSDDTSSEWSATAQFTDTFSSFRFGGIRLEGLKLD